MGSALELILWAFGRFVIWAVGFFLSAVVVCWIVVCALRVIGVVI